MVVALEAIVKGLPKGAEMTPTQMEDNFLLSPGPRRVAVRWGIRLKLLTKRETEHSFYRELYSVPDCVVVHAICARSGEFRSYHELRCFLEGLSMGMKINGGEKAHV